MRPAAMLFLAGSKRSARCEECGANVFTKHSDEPLRYACNGCNAVYLCELLNGGGQ